MPLIDSTFSTYGSLEALATSDAVTPFTHNLFSQQHKHIFVLYASTGKGYDTVRNGCGALTISNFWVTMLRCEVEVIELGTAYL